MRRRTTATKQQRQSSDQAVQGARNVADIYRLTPLQRGVDKAVSVVASVPFLLCNVLFITAWITFHSLTYSAARERNPRNRNICL